MNDNRLPLTGTSDSPAPRGPDLDDLIFQDEGWLASDR